jgi:hypothetical protein
MASTNQTWKLWLLRISGATLLVLSMLTGLAGAPSAFAHDDDDDHDIVTYGPNACTPTADLPAYPNATCVKHEVEQDDDGTETKNEFVTQDTADTVRRSYEAAFSQHGWTVVESSFDVEDQEWEYTVTKGVRRVEVTVERQKPDEGTGTELQVTEE